MRQPNNWIIKSESSRVSLIHILHFYICILRYEFHWWEHSNRRKKEKRSSFRSTYHIKRKEKIQNKVGSVEFGMCRIGVHIFRGNFFWRTLSALQIFARKKCTTLIRFCLFFQVKDLLNILSYAFLWSTNSRYSYICIDWLFHRIRTKIAFQEFDNLSVSTW